MTAVNINGPVNLLKGMPDSRFIEALREVVNERPPFNEYSYQVDNVRKAFLAEVLRRSAWILDRKLQDGDTIQDKAGKLFTVKSAL